MVLGFNDFSYAENRDLDISKVIVIRDSVLSCQSVNRLGLRHIIIYQSVSGLFRNLERYQLIKSYHQSIVAYCRNTHNYQRAEQAYHMHRE